MKWFADLSLSRKLLIGFSIVTLILALQGGFSYFVSKNLGELSTNIYQQNLIPIKRISKINPLLYQYRWEMLLLIEELDSDEIFSQIEEVEKKNVEIDSFIEKIDFDSIATEKNKFVSVWSDVKENLQRLKILLQKEDYDDEKALNLILKGKVSLDNAINVVEVIVHKLEKDAQRSFNSALKIQKQSNLNIGVIIFIGVLISILLAIFISRIIVKPVSLLMESTCAINKGNLDEKISPRYKDEIGTLAFSFDEMRLSIKKKISDLAEMNAIIEESNKNLEIKVEERTKEIQEILNAIQQGIVTMNSDFTLNKEHSLQAEYIFQNKQFENKPLFELMQLDDKKIDTFKKWYKFISKPENIHRWEKYSRLAPRELNLTSSQGTKIIRFDYQPMIKGSKIEKIMVLAEDITLMKSIEAEREKEKKLHEHQMNTIRAIIIHHKDSLGSFIEQSDKIINRLIKYDFQDLTKEYDAIYRDIHTIKGNGGTLGFMTFANLLHEVETFLSAHSEEILKTENEILFEDWKLKLSEVKIELEYIVDTKLSLFPDQGGNGFYVNNLQFEKILRDLSKKTNISADEVIDRMQDLNSEAFDKLLNKYKKLTAQYAEKLNKNIKEPVILSADKLMHRNLFKFFDNSLVHLIRNAIDHGIEKKGERQAKNKGNGEIRFDLIEKEDMVGISLEDNGRGIDINAISAKALEKGLFSEQELEKMSKEEKQGIIFIPGFSSAEKVTDISGRGVGLDAVKTDIEKLGGKVDIVSEVGVFTKITVWLPNDLHLNKALNV